MIVARRTWHCDGCGVKFRTFADEAPDCPNCHGEGRPPSPPARSELNVATASLSDGTKNLDGITRSMMAEHGMTDMRDNQRAGDIAAPPLQGGAAEMLKQAGGSIWRNPGGMSSMVPGQGNYSGVDKGAAMKHVQNIAKQIEGR